MRRLSATNSDFLTVYPMKMPYFYGFEHEFYGL